MHRVDADRVELTNILFITHENGNNCENKNYTLFISFIYFLLVIPSSRRKTKYDFGCR